MESNVKLSQRKFAKYIGVSEGAIRKAIERGDISIGYDADTKQINRDLAMKNDWVQQQSVVKKKAGIGSVQVAAKLNNQTAHGTQSDNKKDDEEIEDLITNHSTEELLACLKLHPDMSMQDANRVSEIVTAALNKKKLEELEGVLVRKDAVEKTLFALGSELKKALFNLPQRVVRDIMASENEVEAINILNTELTFILDTYGNLKSNSIK